MTPSIRTIALGVLILVLGVSIALWGFDYQLTTCSDGPGNEQCSKSPLQQAIGIGTLAVGTVVALSGVSRIWSAV